MKALGNYYCFIISIIIIDYVSIIYLYAIKFNRNDTFINFINLFDWVFNGMFVVGDS